MNEQIYAFIADGEDSFISMQIDNQHFPMVCAARRENTLVQMKRAAAALAKRTGLTIRLYKFTNREEMEVFAP